jgi:hypothetical protein
MIEPSGWLIAGFFGGGVLGAAFGGLASFVLCGLASIAGTIVLAVGGDGTFNTLITWGPLLGPQSAFAGGVAAAAYAAHKGLLPSGRDIASPLLKLNRPDVLAVGGVFGLLGGLVCLALTRIPNLHGFAATNAIATAVVVAGITARLVFGRTGLWGRVTGNAGRFSSTAGADDLPWRVPSLQLFILALGVSLPVSATALALPKASGIYFGLAAVSLGFLMVGIKVPVLIHIVLAAELFTLASRTIWWGIAMGLVAALLAEIFACLFLIHGDTHIDPPAMALSLVYPLLPLLSAAGALKSLGLFPPLAVLILCAGGFFWLDRLSRSGRAQRPFTTPET